MAKKSRIDSEVESLNALFKKVEKIDDDELKSHFARYLCVRVAGLIEISIKTMIKDYTLTKCPHEIVNFVESSTKRLTNMSCEKISQCLGAFNKNWGEKFKTELSDEGKDAIDAIIANRHQIGHGGSSGLTYHRIKNYYDATLKVLKQIKKNFLS